MGKRRNFMDSQFWKWEDSCCNFSSDRGGNFFGGSRKQQRSGGQLGPGPVVSTGTSFFSGGTSGVIGILDDLTPGTALDFAIIDGVEVPLSSFITFNRRTCVVTFEGAGGTLIFANAKEISAIAFPATTTTPVL